MHAEFDVEGGYISGAGLTVPLRFADYARNSTEMLNLIAAGDTSAAAELLSIAPEGTILFMSNGLQGGAGVEVGLGISDRTQSPEALVTAYAINQAFMSGQSVPDVLLSLVANNPELFANADFQSMMQVEIAGKLGPDAYNQFNLDAIKTLANAGRIDLIPEEQQCFGAEVPIDMWPLEAEFAPDRNNPYKQYDQEAVRAKIWKKPIELIRVGDYVVSHDKNGNMVPGYVPRTFQNRAKVNSGVWGRYHAAVVSGWVCLMPSWKLMPSMTSAR